MCTDGEERGQFRVERRGEVTRHYMGGGNPHQKDKFVILKKNHDMLSNCYLYRFKIKIMELEQQAGPSSSRKDLKVPAKKSTRDFYCHYQGQGQIAPYMHYDVGAEDGRIFFFSFLIQL